MPKFEIGERVCHAELPWLFGVIKERENTMSPRYEVVWDDLPMVVCQEDEHRLDKIVKATETLGFEVV